MKQTALAAVFEGPGKPLQLQRLPVPEPTGSELLVQVTGCTLCGSDLHTHEGRRTTPLPTILGHEIIGRIAALGPEAARVDLAGHEIGLGDCVTWSVVASCGECFYCQRSLPQKCERMIKYGHEAFRPGHELRGGLAEQILLAPGTALIRLPETLSDEAACPASCATATVAAALEAAGEIQRRVVLVLGAGMLGLTACAMARAGGAAEVICCDLQAARLARANEFGATQLAEPDRLPEVIAAIAGTHGVDVALELSGSPAALEQSLPLVRIGGIMVLVGAVFPTRSVAISPEQIVRRQLTLRGVHNYAPRHLATAVEFLAASRLPFANMVAEWLPLSEVERAFESAREPGVFRVGVRP